MLKIGIIGLGNIGSNLYRVLKEPSLKRYIGEEISIEGVCDIRERKELRIPKNLFTTDYRRLTSKRDIDIIIELVGGLRPAREIILSAIKNKKHIITANKFLLAYKGREIFQKAKEYNVNIGFEASVCAGIPIIKILRETLLADKIIGFQGIINGTTNFILSEMAERNFRFSEALREAQKRGIAERDPSLDIEGKDSLHKLIILNYLCFGVWIPPQRISVQGIKGISLMDIIYAQELGYTIKLLASSLKAGDGLYSYVNPVLLARKHPLSKIDQDYNAVFIKSNLAGKLLFQGKGAGRKPTVSAIITDILEVSKGYKLNSDRGGSLKFKDIEDMRSRFYIRFMAKDQPGVLAKIASILASQQISIASVTQKERSKTKVVPIVMLTHETKNKAIKEALKRIGSLPVIKGKPLHIKIEE